MLTLSQTKISGVITPSGGQKKPKFVLIDRESILGKENSSDSLLTDILYHARAREGKQKLQMKTFSELAECLARIPTKITLYGLLCKYN